MKAKDVWHLTNRELLELLLQGTLLSEGELEERAFRGVSLGIPGVIKKLTWTKFHKVFTRDEEGLRGWNVRLIQNGLDTQDQAMMQRGAPKTFGHFRVRKADHEDSPRYLGKKVNLSAALILDYGLAPLATTSAIRDPIVSIGNELILGWSYLEVGPLQIPTPSFFTLQDAGPRDHYVAI